MEDLLHKLDKLIWEQYAMVFEDLNTGIYVADMESHELLFANKYIKEQYGEDIIGKPCYQVFHNLNTPCANCLNANLIKDGVPQPPYVWEHQNAETKKWIRSIEQAIQWSDGRYVRLQVYLDINESKRTKDELIIYQNHLRELVEKRTYELQQEVAKHKEVVQRLRQSEDRYKALVKSLPVGLYQIGENADCFYATDVTSRMLGVPIEGLLGLNWTNIIHPEDKDSIVAQWRSCVQKQEPFDQEYRFARPDGTVVWVKALANPYIDNDQRLSYVGTLTDITEAKEREEALRLSSERFAETFANCPSAMCIVNLNSLEYIDVNEKWVTLTGYSRQEIIGQKYYDFKLWQDKSTFQRLKKIIEKQGAFYNEELTIITKTCEKRIGLTSAVVRDFQNIRYISIVIHDITENKKFEKELKHLERLNLVGQMAAGIGHEVRNPMTTVRGLLQILSSKTECAKYKEQYDLMISELDRANSIITEYLSLAKKEVSSLKPLNLNHLIETLYPLLMADALSSNKDIRILLQSTPDLMLDQKEIRQLILNLVRNGLDAMAPRGELTISTYVEDEQVVLEVKDEGTGIDEDIIDKLGTPFITTKAEGTGLGLATCYSIAERHNASISLDTSHQGTTFYVKFKCL